MKTAQHHLVTLALFALSGPVVLSTCNRIAFIFKDHAALEWVDARYAAHPWITVAHLLPGLIFFLVGPLQFNPKVRRFRQIHRTLGRIFITSGILSSLGVMWMVIAFPAVGGLLTQAVTFALTFVMIGLMIHAVRAVRQANLHAHQTAMIRAYTLGLTVSTARIFIEAAEYFLALPFEQSFTMCSALALIVNTTVTERLFLPRLRSFPRVSSVAK